MSSARAWSLITIGNERQYGGNLGYEDAPSKIYRYDSDVANHKQVAEGDLVLVRDRDRLLGIARVHEIRSTRGEKVRQRCPNCGSVAIKRRATRTPPWRCVHGHEFAAPRVQRVEVTKYEADFGESFVLAADAVPVAELKAAAVRPSDQTSIEEIDLRKIEARLVGSYHATRDALAAFLQSRCLSADEANDDTDGDSYEASMTDERNKVLRSIRERRGQRRFRDQLVRRYGSACMVTGCSMMDIVEAAHIWPYRGERDNHPENGLLLRADLHTLFDLNFMAIEPGTLAVRFLDVALRSGYAQWDGRVLRTAERAGPATAPLKLRWHSFVEQQGGSLTVVRSPSPTAGIGETSGRGR